jgi:Bacterial antitoxin of type II TA system, VapB
MRTTLDLDDLLVESLVARNPGVPRTEAIERAIRAYLEADSVGRLLALAGTFDITDVSTELRAVDRTT